MALESEFQVGRKQRCWEWVFLPREGSSALGRNPERVRGRSCAVGWAAGKAGAVAGTVSLMVDRQVMACGWTRHHATTSLTAGCAPSTVEARLTWQGPVP